METLLARARVCARVVSKARPLDPTDLSAAAGPELALDEADRGTYAGEAIDVLEARCTALLGAAGDALDALDASIADTEAQSLELRRRLAAGERREALAPLLDGLDDARDELDDALVAASRFSLSEALLPFATGELVDAGDGWFATIRRVRNALAEKRGRLEAATSVTSGESSLRGRETVLRVLRDAIRHACDGDAFPVWPPFLQTDATAPQLDAAPGVPETVGPWVQVRPALRDAVALAGTLLLRTWKTPPRSTVRADDADPTEGRPEEERPLNEYAAIYLDPAGGPLDREPDGRRMLAGFVADEWSALRPSRMQGTALAVHYDAPAERAAARAAARRRRARGAIGMGGGRRGGAGPGDDSADAGAGAPRAGCGAPGVRGTALQRRAARWPAGPNTGADSPARGAARRHGRRHGRRGRSPATAA